MLAGGILKEERVSNLLDGGAPFYDIYETSDGEHMSVGSLEPQFYEVLLKLLDAEDAPDRYDLSTYDELRDYFAAKFITKTQAEWTEIFEGTDACVAPILKLSDAMEHPHMVDRGVFVDKDGLKQPAPAPRFSRTEATLRINPPEAAGANTTEALTAWGIKDVEGLIAEGVAVQV